jgi:hypothetical protein
MAIRVADDVPDRVVRDRGGFYLQVQVRSGFEAARRALEAAAEEIATLDAGWESAYRLRPGDANTLNHVSEVNDSPIGPDIYIDVKHRSGSSWLLASDDLPRVRAAHGEYGLGAELVVAARGPRGAAPG